MILSNEPLFRRLLILSPFSEWELVALIHTAPLRYKDHYILKRNGRGRRLISQPTLELKFLQRLLVSKEFVNLPMHDAAVAYRRCHSIKDHAAPHASNKYLLKLDFKDFFPSLEERTLRYRLSRDTHYSDAEMWILCQLLLRRKGRSDGLRLSIGAPSSPFVSNYVMWEFDSKLSEFCDQGNARYSRYADDLAISSSEPRFLDRAEAFVRHLLSDLSYLGLALNEDKTVNVSKKNKRVLTGLVLANDGNVSVGRDEKRKLRAAVDHALKGGLSLDDVGSLKGRLAFVRSVDANFVDKLLLSYGLNSIGEL